jgi:putative nucleotidyltransferase with HDIG domain
MKQPTDPSAVPPHAAHPPAPESASLRISKCEGPIQIQASTQQSWDEAVQRVILPVEKSRWQREQLRTLLRTDYHLCHAGSLEQSLQAILQDTARVLGAQRGAIALQHEATGELRVQAVIVRHRGITSRDGFSNTLARRCFERGESLLCHDVRADAALQAAGSVVRGSMASMLCALLRSPRQRLGVLHLDRGPLQPPFTSDDLYLIDAIAAKASVGIESARLAQQQQEQFIQTLTTLARTVDARDRGTATHAQRVTAYALCLATALGLSDEEVQRVRLGTPLHDIGKIGIPDAILHKPGRLNDDELEQMKQHPVRGVVILESFQALRPVLPIVRSHHERWDGQGYPDGLAGEAIAREARVVAVADVFDALTSERPYRVGMPAAEAFAEIGRHAGTQFDPAAASTFLAVRQQVEELLATFRAGPGPEAAPFPSATVGAP